MSEKMDRIYYRVEPDSPVMAVIQKAYGSHRAFTRAMTALRKEIKASEVWITGGIQFCGARFSGELPPGWRMNAKYAVPDKRNKIGKELSRKIESLPRAMDSWDFSHAMNKEFPANEKGNSGFFHWGDGQVSFTSWGKYGDAYVLSVPAGCRVNLEGCTELKMSEYWQLKESAKKGRAA